MAALLERQLALVGALREAGLLVSVAESLDAARAMSAVELLDREQLRAAFAATMVKRQVHRPVFDRLFDLYFPPVTGESSVPRSASAPAPRDPDAAPRGPLEDPRRDRIREMVADFLREGRPEQVEQAVREAVDAFGAVPGSGGRPSSWSQLAVLGRVSAQTLMAGLLEAVLAGQDRGGLAERQARTMITDRRKQFEQRVVAEVARRLAELTDADTVARTTARPALDKVSFLGAGRDDLAALRREIAPLARRLATRLAQDQRRGLRGQLDVRATMRSALSTGGVPMETKHRPRRPLKSDLVVICDLSESVTSFAHFTLLFVYALREQFSRVRAFGFVDELDELTRFFRPGADVLDVVADLTAQADVTWLYGRTDYGHAFELFAARFADAIGPRTSLLVLGDARSNYGALGLPVVQGLCERAKHAYWLNPESRRQWDTGDSRAAEYAELMPMIECRNLSQLSEFVRGLAL